MTCGEFRDLVFDYLGGTLPDAEPFRAHRDACADCAGRLRGIEENERLLRGARVPAAPADLWPGIARAISAGRATPFQRLRRSALWAAAAVLVLAAGLLLGPRAPSPEPRLDVVIVEVAPDARTAYRGLLPTYEQADELTAMAGTGFRSDDF